MPNDTDQTAIDMHVHVGLIGDRWPESGKMSEQYRESWVYKIFLMYAKLEPDEVSDQKLKERTLEVIATTGVDKVVCLALDPVYSAAGKHQEALSHFWVANEYIIKLQKEAGVGEKILLGASVHPYDPDFKERVKKYVDNKAVLLKWLPSAQQIDLADVRIKEALKFLASAGIKGKPLPLLLHVGPEYAIPTTNPKTTSYDYLHWSEWDSIVNFFRLGGRFAKPNIKKLHENLLYGLNEGATIIFAHCGLPYFFTGFLGGMFEHSEFKQVKDYLKQSSQGKFKGKCFADVSAFATPFRQKYFSKIRQLPEDLLLYGSDFPTPAFELSADIRENLEDLEAILKGDLSRIIIPEDNLLDVNRRELFNAFPGHSLFNNAKKIINNT